LAQFIHHGESVDYKPSSDVAAGDIVVLNTLIGVAKRDIKANTLGALHLVGVFDVDKVLADTFAIGEAVYWDEATSKATSSAVDTIVLGKAVADAAMNATTVRVRL
jgi:predicted RecA/RadA family phage recombinase